MSQTPSKPRFSWLSLKEIFRLFLFLDTEQFKVLLTRRLQGQKTAQEWIQKLDLLARFDAQADNARTTAATLGIISMIIVVVSIIIDANYYDKQPFWGLIGKIALLSSLLFIFLYFLLKKIDLENRLRYFVYPLIQVLLEEGKANTPIDLQLELKPNKSKRYKTAVRRNKPIPKFRKFANWSALISLTALIVIAIVLNFYTYVAVLEDFLAYSLFGLIGSLVLIFIAYIAQLYPLIITTIYTYPWLSFSARMADDTLLAVSFTDTLINTKKIRTNARGKIKIKTKQSLKRLTVINIGFDKENYIFHSQAPQTQHTSWVKISPKPKEKRHAFKIQHKQKLLSNFEPRLDTLLGLIARGYQKMKKAS
ncbi:MAG: hypothetical protein OHK0045_10430 [Raineya sp.]